MIICRSRGDNSLRRRTVLASLLPNVKGDGLTEKWTDKMMVAGKAWSGYFGTVTGEMAAKRVLFLHYWGRRQLGRPWHTVERRTRVESKRFSASL
jgi:hypothetical protein